METFIEYRDIQDSHKPYWGEQYTQLGAGVSPGVWETQFPPVPFFENRVEKFEIPYTSLVKTCYNCHGTGRVTCSKCHGNGYTEKRVQKDDKWVTERETCMRSVIVSINTLYCPLMLIRCINDFFAFLCMCIQLSRDR